MSLVWINGTLVDKSEAKISVFDHGFLYGDGVWEHFRAFGGKLLWPEDHWVALLTWIVTARIPIPFSRDELFSAIDQTLQANQRLDAYIRVIVTRGMGTLGPDPRKLEPQVIIVAEEYQPYPSELYESGIHLNSQVFVSARRTLSLAAVVGLKRVAHEAGCLDSVLLDEIGTLNGCIEGDVFFASSNGTICQHHPTQSFVGRGGFDAFLNSLGLLLNGRPTWRLEDLMESNEAFIVGTSCGVIGISRVNGVAIGNGTEGPITKRIREAYRTLTRGT
jgi:branched-chain amino acid aminotransferase